ncbi:UNVERIFIED_CONTAM: ARF guanine-nucleotide exchange factor GNL1 [Sesamum radiatum]|uniref:ARF guanine-nucleotide exchange factor GNL1 n=1 Tax=Sesamum radiatum TaxID=300843 RepID=A0AAW2P869_SESRA
MEKYMKMRFRGKRSEKIHELVPELLKNTLLVMKTSGILVPSDPVGGDSFWQLTWLHVKNIAPSLQLEVFPSEELEKLQEKHGKAGCSPLPDGNGYDDEVFESYERQYCELSANLSKKTSSVSNLDGEQQKQKISEVRGGLDEAEALAARDELLEAGMADTLTLHGVDDNISRSKRVITTMSRRMSRNKWIIGAIISVLVLVILLVLYLKLAK